MHKQTASVPAREKGEERRAGIQKRRWEREQGEARGNHHTHMHVAQCAQEHLE